MRMKGKKETCKLVWCAVDVQMEGRRRQCCREEASYACSGEEVNGVGRELKEYQLVAMKMGDGKVVEQSKGRGRSFRGVRGFLP